MIILLYDSRIPQCQPPSSPAIENDGRESRSDLFTSETSNDTNYSLNLHGSKQTDYKTADLDISSVKSSVDQSIMIQSFYERTIMLNSTNTFLEDESFSSDSSMHYSKETSPTPDDKRINIFPHHKVPTYEETIELLPSYDLPEFVHARPVYKDFNDVTSKKEIGHNILHIASDSLKGLPLFESMVVLPQDKKSCISRLRERAFTGMENDEKVLNVDQYLSTEEIIKLCPLQKPPSHMEAKAWLVARGSRKDVEEVVKNIEDDSPEKVKIEKAINVPDVKIASEEEDPEVTVINSSVKVSQKSLQKSKFKNNLETKFNFNVTSVSPVMTIDLSDIERAAASDNTPSLPTSFKRRKLQRWRLSLSKRLESKRLQSLHVDTSETSKNSPSTVTTSQSSTKSSESDAVSTTLVNQYMEANSTNLNMSSAFDLSCSLLDETQNFKVDLENLKNANAQCEFTYLTVINIELFMRTREDLRPDPAIDGVQAIFYHIVNDVPESCQTDLHKCGVIVHGLDELKVNVFRRSGFKADILVVDDEVKMMEHFVHLIRKLDPDILSGYEIEKTSWGYLIDRGNVLGLDMLTLLSRVLPSERKRPDIVQVEDDPGAGADKEYENDIQIRGRILLNVWRLIRHEIALTAYNFENVVYHVLHQRVPLHSYKFLTHKWSSPLTIGIVVEYFLFKSSYTLEILNTLDLIGRTCELAKLFGIQFFEVLSRGSQFRVESMMMRISKPMNYVSVSPSIQQRATMRAPEYLPLILEPLSRFYSDPLVVLDFQSLYPSVIIGYNYCFSTCLGRVEHIGT